jgi:hexosaminidase
MKFYTPCLFLFFLLTACSPKEGVKPTLLPIAKKVSAQASTISVRNHVTASITQHELMHLMLTFNEEKRLLIGKHDVEGEPSVRLEMEIDEKLGAEEYILRVTENIYLSGGSYNAVAMGMTTLLQSISPEGTLPRMRITDSPDYGYRSLMLDVARSYYSVESLKSAIDLCRWYKLNYLQLHLTDDSAFTFPSTAFPKLTTQGHSYTLKELEELNEYARLRGVTLVPEIDVPGHSSVIIREMPELFGIGTPSNNPYTVSMGREDTYAALDTLIGEVAAAFPYSPYIHIGGDEAFFAGMDEDPATIAYRKKHDLGDVHELFRHFLIRLNDMVRANDRQTIVWSGFGEQGELEIPTNVIVMAWQAIYHHPEALLKEGRPIINAAFKPLYVVNNRKWPAKYIYEVWNPNRWESWEQKGAAFEGIELPENDAVMGATMCIWEQRETNMMPRLIERIPAMAAKLWNESSMLDPLALDSVLFQTTEQFKRLQAPFEVVFAGLSYPEAGEGNFNEHRYFFDVLSVLVDVPKDGYTIEYSATNKRDDRDWKTYGNPFDLTETTHLRVRALDEKGKQVGREFYQVFYLHPIFPLAVGLERDLPIGSWEKRLFENTVLLSLDDNGKGRGLHYTTDGSRVTPYSPEYTGPIEITETTTVRAQLFDEKDVAYGAGFSETYNKLIKRPSLTTDKKVWAHNEEFSPGLGHRIADGRIALWEHWGDTKGEENWIQVDLGKSEWIERLNLTTFWDGYRYYQFTVEGSDDGENWTLLWDDSENTTPATRDGYNYVLKGSSVRYLKVNMLYNSSNPGLHVVEFSAW